MNLITEHIEDVEVITEAKEDGKKNYFIEGIFMQGDLKNRNGRIYPSATLEQEMTRYNTEFIQTKRALGELGHPDGPQINGDRVSHLITEMRQTQEAWKDQLKEEGRNYVEELNWIYKPTFDSEKNAVYVSYEGSWNGKKGKYKSMQTNSIVLGRNGYLDISFVSSITNETTKEELQQIANLAKDFTDGIDFLEGSKHADYKSGDKVAALGIGSLVAGTLGVKALAKVGFLAKIAPFLMKFWWIIFAPIAAIVGMSSNKKKSPQKRKRKEVDYD